jgi:hypothetical protein
MDLNEVLVMNGSDIDRLPDEEVGRFGKIAEGHISYLENNPRLYAEEAALAIAEIGEMAIKGKVARGALEIFGITFEATRVDNYTTQGKIDRLKMLLDYANATLELRKQNFPFAGPNDGLAFAFNGQLGDDSSDAELLLSMVRKEARCFPASTPIRISRTASTPISRLRPGDTVLAFDPRANRGRGALVARRVARLYRNTTTEWVRLRWVEEGAAREVVSTPGPGHGGAGIGRIGRGDGGADRLVGRDDASRRAGGGASARGRCSGRRAGRC